MTSSPHLAALQRDGFVVIPSLLSPDEIDSLYDAATLATYLARTGQWPYFRTVPKQFPPWPDVAPPASEGGIWGVQHLLHPAMPRRTEFARLYFSEKILKVVEELLEVSSPQSSGGSPEREEGEEVLVMELLNLLVAPETKDFELRWHRDGIPETATGDEELNLLQEKCPDGRQFHAQYNIALCPDSSLIVVPGSHRRARTDIELNADPYESNLQGQQVVQLQPGDAVFYDSNILHRGVYKHKTEEDVETRLTLHGSVGLKSHDGKVRATAVLQHGVGQWAYREDAPLNAGERAERMRRNLVAMGRGDDVGYALQG